MNQKTFLSCAASAAILVASAVGAEPRRAPADPPARAGATAPDPFPNGCVDCHLNFPERNLDVRLSTLMTGWRKEVEPRLLAKARAVSGPGAKISGRHPDAAGALRSVPEACLACHRKSSTNAPPFASLIHAIHLTGGPDNHYVAQFQGACTHCHKLDPATGTFRVPTAPEK